jgi:hypothetical protein
LLGKLFELEVQRAQFASARGTFRPLSKERAGSTKVAAVRDRAAEVDRLINGGEPISAKGAIYNPCNCDAGQRLWSYVPARRTFSFSNLDGNVERFEVRCENERISESIVTDNEPVEQAGVTTVARIDVLDR